MTIAQIIGIVLVLAVLAGMIFVAGQIEVIDWEEAEKEEEKP